ncbi:hypothetical protein DAI22_02g005001 [Oryza sativa Japonica Group]|nr:hypothetical protein DAI22_02g005001 [Oryza sativa Japonica Group]
MLCAAGGNKTNTPGPDAQSALRALALARSGMNIGRIEREVVVGRRLCRRPFIAMDMESISSLDSRSKASRRESFAHCPEFLTVT